MLEVITYKISYRPEDDAGMVHLALENDQATDVYIDSPQELSLCWISFVMKNLYTLI